MSAESLQTQLSHEATAMGATYFGVADLRPVRKFVVAQGGDFLARYPVGVSVGIVLADGVVDLLYLHDNGDVARTYFHHIYSVVAGQLDRIATTLAFRIEQSGYSALPVPQGRPYNDARLAGLVSHKLVAHLAGHGRIGKNCLLITTRHGPRVRWVTVLTDAPLDAHGAPLDDEDPCKSCSLCVDLCPMQAFTGVPFNPEEPVQVRFNTTLCREYLRERDKMYGARVCGACIHVCPHGYSVKRKKDVPITKPKVIREQFGVVRSRLSDDLRPRLLEAIQTLAKS